jgi:hypothetical protein
VTPLVTGVFVACTVVTLMRWLQVHDRRLLPLTGLFLMLAVAESLEWWHRWRGGFLLAAAAFGIALIPMLDRRRSLTDGGGRHPGHAPHA